MNTKTSPLKPEPYLERFANYKHDRSSPTALLRDCEVENGIVHYSKNFLCHEEGRTMVRQEIWAHTEAIRYGRNIKLRL